MPTSARSGIFSRVKVSFVRSDAIISGRAAFFAPEILITPFSFWPPTIRIRSNKSPYSKTSKAVRLYPHRFCEGPAFGRAFFHRTALSPSLGAVLHCGVSSPAGNDSASFARSLFCALRRARLARSASRETLATGGIAESAPEAAIGVAADWLIKSYSPIRLFQNSFNVFFRGSNQRKDSCPFKAAQRSRQGAGRRARGSTKYSANSDKPANTKIGLSSINPVHQVSATFQ